MVGLGAVGTRVVRHLLSSVPAVSGVEVTMAHRSASRLEFTQRDLGVRTGAVLGGVAELPGSLDVVVLATPDPVAEARRALGRGAHVVSVDDHPEHTRALLDLDAMARRQERSLVVGAAFAPGMSCVLALMAASRLDRVTEVHIARMGTGGPACAHHHHAALSSPATDWNDGVWVRRPGGSGRELVWFPEPVGGADCYRAGLADAVLLAPAFPGVRRITSRLEATRRDRVTSWLPMLRPPHPEGLVGAIRVEVRGFRGDTADTSTLGASSPPALAAAAVATASALWAGAGRLARPGAGGLAEMVGSPGPWLQDLATLGVASSEFLGSGDR